MTRNTALVLGLALALGATAHAQTPVGFDALGSVPLDPIGIENAGDGSGRLFIVQQPGVIAVWDGTQFLPTPFLDIQDRVNDNSSERGLLGLAFHPDYETNGLFYVHYSDSSGDTQISRFSVTADPDVADPNSELPILSQNQPFNNHNGGKLAFGPDGYLYIALGDGGSGGDPQGNGQDLGTLLGKLLRIDVDGDDFPGDLNANYAIPADNPFVGLAGRDEIWAYGLRNPWRFSFDRENGDLFIGDVGQNVIEEVDLQPASSSGGENYGWNRMEGSDCFEPPTDCNDGSLVLPILEYPHFDGGFLGCSITGGFRYRGSRNPLLQGVYFYGDYCTGRVWGGVEIEGLWTSPAPLVTSFSIPAFGEGEDGELYLSDLDTNTIYRLHDTRPFCDVELNADTYGVGDTVTLTVARLVNRGDSAASLRFQLGAIPPGGSFQAIIDRDLTLAADSDLDKGPRNLFTVQAGTPTGAYQLVCNLLDGGTQVATDTVSFEIR